jgi:hypothetical protein
MIEFEQQRKKIKTSDMKVGDLVRCTMVDGKPIGLVVERFEHFPNVDIFYVLIPGYVDSFPIRASQMEIVNANR